MGSRPLRVSSWNVNGLRAIAGKGFHAWMKRDDADIVGIQETRARLEQLAPSLAHPKGYDFHLTPAERAGYSGVGIYTRVPADRVDTGLGDERFDCEGRVQIARFGRLVVANAYFPNGNGPDRSNSRVPYKLDFYRAVFDAVQRRRKAGLRVLVMGDFNTAHRDIDLARPKQNKKTSGFLTEEREELDRWIRAGWVDTFREFHEGEGHYTWWSQRGTARQRNVGWRIDYVLCSPNVRPFLTGAFIQPEIAGSDHCPLGVELERGVLG